jgi:hypothetical protein
MGPQWLVPIRQPISFASWLDSRSTVLHMFERLPHSYSMVSVIFQALPLTSEFVFVFNRSGYHVF